MLFPPKALEERLERLTDVGARPFLVVGGRDFAAGGADQGANEVGQRLDPHGCDESGADRFFKYGAKGCVGGALSDLREQLVAEDADGFLVDDPLKRTIGAGDVEARLVASADQIPKVGVTPSWSRNLLLVEEAGQPFAEVSVQALDGFGTSNGECPDVRRIGDPHTDPDAAHVCSRHTSEVGTMEHEEMQALVEHHLKAEGAGDVDGAVSVYTDDIEHDVVGLPGGPLHGKAAARSFYEDLTANFRTEEERPTHRYWADDAMILDQEMTGTVTGSLLGAPGNGRRITFRILHVFEFRGGLISRENVWLDSGAIFQQLG